MEAKFALRHAPSSGEAAAQSSFRGRWFCSRFGALADARGADGLWQEVVVKVNGLSKLVNSVEVWAVDGELLVEDRAGFASSRVGSQGETLWIVCENHVLALRELEGKEPKQLEDLVNRFWGPSALKSRVEALKQLHAFLEAEVHEISGAWDEIVRLGDVPSQLREINPLASSKKTKEGSLQVQTETSGRLVLKKQYFCVHGNRLYFFENSTDEAPSGFFPLDHAVVSINADDAEQGIYTLLIETALQSMVVRAKHLTALQQWKTALALSDEQQQRPGIPVDGDRKSCDTVLRNRHSRQYFRRFLERQGEERLLRFFLLAKKHRQACNRYTAQLAEFLQRQQEEEEKQQGNQEGAESKTDSIEEVENGFSDGHSECKEEGEGEREGREDPEGGEEEQGQVQDQESDSEEEEPLEEEQDQQVGDACCAPFDGEEEEEAEARDGQPIESENDLMAAMEDSCLTLTSDFIDPDGSSAIDFLEQELESIEDSIQAQEYTDCFATCETKVLEQLGEICAEFFQSDEYQQLVDALRPEDQPKHTLFGTKLLVVREKDSGKTTRVQLSPGKTTIGRDWSNSLVLEHRKVSRAHCVLTIDKVDQCVVQDLGSASGTRVNGRLIEYKSLQVGDVIQVPNYDLELIIDVNL